MVELFFHHASKWSKWCAQTLHSFSRTLIIFSGITARMVAPPSGNFQIWSLHWKGLFVPEKTLQTTSKLSKIAKGIKNCLYTKFVNSNVFINITIYRVLRAWECAKSLQPLNKLYSLSSQHILYHCKELIASNSAKKLTKCWIMTIPKNNVTFIITSCAIKINLSKCQCLIKTKVRRNCFMMKIGSLGAK